MSQFRSEEEFEELTGTSIDSGEYKEIILRHRQM